MDFKNNVMLYNGDCLDFIKKINKNSIDCIITDPPYGINFVSNHRKEKYKKIENDDKLDWLDAFFKQSYEILKDNTAIYCFCSWHNIDFFKQSIEKYFKLKNIIIWEKNNTSMGDLKGSYAPKYEMCLFATKGRHLIKGYRYPDILQAKRTGNKLHPTQKPVDLLETFIKTSTNEGDLILDPFMGSGSTGVACKNLNRKFLGIEIDNNYYNIAKERINEQNKFI